VEKQRCVLFVCDLIQMQLLEEWRGGRDGEKRGDQPNKSLIFPVSQIARRLINSTLMKPARR
jgi:hypothetical protein